MKIIRDGLWLCQDCMIIAVNGDYTGLDYSYGSRWKCLTCAREGTGRAPGGCPSCLSEHDANHGPHSCADLRMAEINAGFERLGPHLVSDWDSETDEGIHEFSWGRCDCCNTHLGGSRHRFSILGE